MIDRRTLLLTALIAAGAASLSHPAAAAMDQPYSDASFAEAKKAGKPILVHVSASWCPTCKAQKPIIEGLAGKPEFADLVLLVVDFDAQKDVVRSFGAQMQSTLIAYRGADEAGRSVGDTDPASIEALLRSAL